MRTPKNFQALIKQGIITEEILSESIYSVSKRAKHHRDMEHRYRRNKYHYYYDKYDNAQKSAELKEHFYQQKNKMLEVIEPTGIHTSIHYKEKTIYEYDEDYESMENSIDIINRGKKEMYFFSGSISYFDHELDEYSFNYDERYICPNDFYRLNKAFSLFDEEPVMKEISYINVKIPQSYDIYLYYEYGNKMFHKPIQMGIENREEFEKQVEIISDKYSQLTISEVSDLFVPSKDLTEILSCQFTDKVVELIESGNYIRE